MALGLLDRCCSAETMMRFPAMYKMSQNRSDFNIKVNYDFIIINFWKQKKKISFVGFLDLVFECCLSFYYSLFYVLCNASTWYVEIFIFDFLSSKTPKREIDCICYLDVAHPNGIVFGSHLYLGNYVYTVN